jgi:hypothetical protein
VHEQFDFIPEFDTEQQFFLITVALKKFAEHFIGRVKEGVQSEIPLGTAPLTIVYFEIDTISTPYHDFPPRQDRLTIGSKL